MKSILYRLPFALLGTWICAILLICNPDSAMASASAALASGGGKFFSLDSVRRGIQGEVSGNIDGKHAEKMAAFKPLNRQVQTLSRSQMPMQKAKNRKEEVDDSTEEQIAMPKNMQRETKHASDPDELLISLYGAVDGVKSSVRHQWPIDPDVKQRLSSDFGPRPDPFTGEEAFHAGIDIAVPAGTPVLASAEGVVSGVGTHPRLGRYVKVTHADDSYSLYGHLQEWDVAEGQRVFAGTRLGEVGMSGRTTGPHLDYSLRKDGMPMDPLDVLHAPFALKKLAFSDMNVQK